MSAVAHAATELAPLAGERTSRFRSPSTVLFLALFASQAGVLVLAPILADVADEFDVSIAAAGQLRILAAPLAVVVAIAAGRMLVRFSPRALLADVADEFDVSIAAAGQLRILAAPLAVAVAIAAGRMLIRFSPRALLAAGSALLAVGSLASAAAPSFELLALAQVPTWAGVTLLMAAGVAATAAWSEPERRTKVVAHALAGPPTAWIVGMPVTGLVAAVDWRLAFVALPLPASLIALLAVAGRPQDEPLAGTRSSLVGLLGRRDARRWATGELLANSAWAGTLVFSGALFTEVHGWSSAATGVVLALIAAVYLAGNQWAGRADGSRARRAMLETSTAAGVAIALTWALAPSAAVTIALFGVAGFAAAARTVSGTVFGFAVAGELGREVGTIRATTSQLGYLIGSLVGGVALAVGGFEALAVAFGGLMLASTLPYVCVRRTCRVQTAVA